MTTTALFAKYQAASDALDAGGAWDAFNAVAVAYNEAVAAKTAEWDAIPENAAKWNAEDNANDTVHVERVGHADDRLFWLEIAIGSIEA